MEIARPPFRLVRGTVEPVVLAGKSQVFADLSKDLRCLHPAGVVIGGGVWPGMATRGPLHIGPTDQDLLEQPYRPV